MYWRNKKRNSEMNFLVACWHNLIPTTTTPKLISLKTLTKTLHGPVISSYSFVVVEWLARGDSCFKWCCLVASEEYFCPPDTCWVQSSCSTCGFEHHAELSGKTKHWLLDKKQCNHASNSCLFVPLIRNTRKTFL